MGETVLINSLKHSKPTLLGWAVEFCQISSYPPAAKNKETKDQTHPICATQLFSL